jgi:hypothetical protein
MDLNPQFTEFLTRIRPTDPQRNDLITGHKTLRSRLNGFDDLKDIIVTTFLQGSYRRYTAVRPIGDKRPDVDVVVVTRLEESNHTPQQAMNVFIKFLDKYYKDNWRFHGRSIGIELNYVDLDIVVTSAPSEVLTESLKSWVAQASSSQEDTTERLLQESWTFIESFQKTAAPAWKEEPLRIPDRNTKQWEDTHPLAQMEWTWDKNKACNGHYVNAVKCLKWWRCNNNLSDNHPKGYTFEHLIGSCFPDGVKTVAEGVARALQVIVNRYSAVSQVPYIGDHSVNQNVLGRVELAEFQDFMEQIVGASDLATRAWENPDKAESGKLWKELFGPKFPDPPGGGNSESANSSNGGKGGYSERTGKTSIAGGRFG